MKATYIGIFFNCDTNRLFWLSAIYAAPQKFVCNISMGLCKKGITPLLTHWSYVFLAPAHRYMLHIPAPWTYSISMNRSISRSDVHESGCHICCSKKKLVIWEPDNWHGNVIRVTALLYPYPTKLEDTGFTFSVCHPSVGDMDSGA